MPYAVNDAGGWRWVDRQADLRDGETFSSARPPEPTPPGPSYRDKRKAAYIAELGSTPGDFVETVGDVLDDLIREVRALAAAPVTVEFKALTDKVDAIKARFPKD